MKMVLGAAAVALVMFGAAPAFAQAAACPAAPAAPSLPDGATAKDVDMKKGEKAYEAWRTAANAVVECENTSLKALQSQPNVAKYVEASKAIKEVQDSPEVKDYFAKQDAYNTKMAPIFASVNTWQKSVDAYNTKTGKKK
jgi:hypothetical protein